MTTQEEKRPKSDSCSLELHDEPQRDQSSGAQSRLCKSSGSSGPPGGPAQRGRAVTEQVKRREVLGWRGQARRGGVGCGCRLGEGWECGFPLPAATPFLHPKNSFKKKNNTNTNWHFPPPEYSTTERLKRWRGGWTDAPTETNPVSLPSCVALQLCHKTCVEVTNVLLSYTAAPYKAAVFSRAREPVGSIRQTPLSP